MHHVVLQIIVIIIFIDWFDRVANRLLIELTYQLKTIQMLW